MTNLTIGGLVVAFALLAVSGLLQMFTARAQARDLDAERRATAEAEVEAPRRRHVG